jgi:DNA polymerase sliding clamp subunit (PCNA homolog)
MFVINRAALAAELALLQTVAERKNTIPALENVKIECRGDVTVLTATDLDATIVSKVESSGEPWSGCVPLRQLHSLVKLLEGESTELAEQKNGRLQIKSGQSKHLLPITETKNFPETDIPKGEGFEIDGNMLGTMIKATAFWIRPNTGFLIASEQKQTGLSVRSDGQNLEVMSFKGSAAAIATLPLKTPKFNAVITRQSVAALAYLNEELTVISSEAKIVFQGAARTLISPVLTGEFPAWRTFLPKYEHKVEVPDAFTDTIKRVSVTTTERSAWEVLKLTIAKESLKLESRGGDNGQSEEVLTTTSTLNGDTVSIGINGNQILEALSKSEGNVTCEFVDGSQPMIFTPANKDFELCYLTMPCRLDF